jgi:RNA polymerase sigma-70 factor (subfamily 1)
MSRVNTLLIAEARAGSNAALGQLLQIYRPLLLDLARAAIPTDLAGKASPSDIFQNTCLDAVQSIYQLRGQSEGELRAWLCALLARNIDDTARRFRSKKREVRRERPLDGRDSKAQQLRIASQIVSPEEDATSREEIEHVQQAIARLKPKHRQLIEMRSHARLSFVQMAEQLGTTADAIRMRWNRSIKHLAKELGKDRSK